MFSGRSRANGGDPADGLPDTEPLGTSGAFATLLLGEDGLVTTDNIGIADQPEAQVGPSPFADDGAVPPAVAAFFQQVEEDMLQPMQLAVLDEPCKPGPFGGWSFPSDESPDNSCAAAGAGPPSGGLASITQTNIGSRVMVEIRNATCPAGIGGSSGKAQLPTEWSQLATTGTFVPEPPVPLWPAACAQG